MRKVVAWLTPGQLEEHRRVHALGQIAQGAGGSDVMTLDERVTALVEVERLAGEMREVHGLADDEAYSFDLSDGAICEEVD